MTDEALDEGLEIESEQEEQEQEQEARPSATREDWQRRQEEKASSSGWKDFDDYIENGGDPDKWKTADAYNIYGELVGKMLKDKRDFDARLQNVQKLNDVQVSALKSELQKKRDEAIEDGNKAAVHAFDKQLSELSPQQINRPANPREVEEWNERNPWITDGSAKSDRAYAVFNRALASGKSAADALHEVDTTIAKEFSPRPKPGHVPESERGRGSAGFKGKTESATMDSLSQEEALAWKHAPDTWNHDPKQFLKAVNDLRKADKGKK